MATIKQEVEKLATGIAGVLNTHNAKMGNLAGLTTADKTSLVNAMNEILGRIVNGGGVVIADGETNTTKTWSSNKISQSITAINAIIDTKISSAMSTINVEGITENVFVNLFNATYTGEDVTVTTPQTPSTQPSTTFTEVINVVGDVACDGATIANLNGAASARVVTVSYVIGDGGFYSLRSKFTPNFTGNLRVRCTGAAGTVYKLGTVCSGQEKFRVELATLDQIVAVTAGVPLYQNIFNWDVSNITLTVEYTLY